MIEGKHMREMWNPLPSTIYDKFKAGLCRHIWLHYIAHLTFCLIRESVNHALNCRSYLFYTPEAWIRRERY